MSRRAIRWTLACVGIEGTGGRRLWEGSTGRGQDKRGSPADPQAIDMAWDRACRSVGARAAPSSFINSVKGVFGAVCCFDLLETRP